MRQWWRIIVAIVAVIATSGTRLVASSAAAPTSGGGAGGYRVYWDQNEEEDFYAASTAQVGQLVAPWDPNGQMCLVPDNTGRFVVGYDPTLPNQGNPGSSQPVKQPPVGEAMWDQHGNFTGQTIYVPGPYMLPGQTVGGDIPPDASGVFNNTGTFTGCAFDHRGNLFADDLGTAEGDFPPPDDGRLIEWFGPAYNTYCILDGPTTGGVGPHHVDGTGGLTQPGDMAFAPNGDLMLPEAGPSTAMFSGRVVRYDHTSFPHSAADCGPDGVYPQTELRSSLFLVGNASFMPFPQSVAYDAVCQCFGVATTFGDPSIAWFDNQGHRIRSMGTVSGEQLTQVGSRPNGHNPYGIAFAPDGTLYYVDIHIQCSAPLTNCGPENNAGRVMRVNITNGKPDRAVTIAGGYSFPTSVTVCIPRVQNCPVPLSNGARRPSAPAWAFPGG